MTARGDRALDQERRALRARGGGVSFCRSCQREIVWAVTEHGRRIPLDPVARPDGNVELLRMSGVLVARVLTPEREAEIEETLLGAHRDGTTPALNLHVSHFATCPAADTFRRRRGRAQAPGGAAA